MMHKAALAVLLAAPSALAFTPQDIQGVWSCVIKDGFKNTNYQTALVDAVYESYDTPDEDKNLRVVVFDKPDSSQQTRRLSGRTYLKQDDRIEEHDFHGILKNAVEGDFYLDPNSQNTECGGTRQPAGTVTSPAVPTAADKAKADYHIRLNAANGGSCRSTASGPWSFTMDDPEHFTLIVQNDDTQGPVTGAQSNWELATGWVADATIGDEARIFMVEKCMRGLPLKSTMCHRLARSSVTTDQEMNNACSRNLVCSQSTSSQNWGCANEKCCSVAGYVAPPVYPQYQQPYYQQNYYQPYQQQYTYPYQQQSYTQQAYWG